MRLFGGEKGVITKLTQSIEQHHEQQLKVETRSQQPPCFHSSCLTIICQENLSRRTVVFLSHGNIKSKLIVSQNEKDTIFKEATDLSKAMRGELVDISIMTILRIISTHCNYFVIFLSLIIGTKFYAISLGIFIQVHMSDIGLLGLCVAPDQSQASVLQPWHEESIQE